MDELNIAIQKLRKEYEVACNLKHVRNPLKYALYRIWRSYEIKDRLDKQRQK